MVYSNLQKRRNGSGRNEHRFQQNLTVYTHKFCKGTDKRTARSLENRGTDKDRLHVVFFVTGTDRAGDVKLLRLVRMRFCPYLKRQWMNPHYLMSLRRKRTRTSSATTMYPKTHGSVFKRTYQAASGLHNFQGPTAFVAAFLDAAFFFLSAILPRRCRA